MHANFAIRYGRQLVRYNITSSVMTDVRVVAIVLLSVATARAQPASLAGWDDGFFIQTADGTSRLTIGGYTQFDGRFFVADSADPHVDQFGFRAIRPELKGTVLGHFDFRVLPDFAQGKTTIQDAYVEAHYGGLVRVRVGKFKVPFGLERLQRDVYTTFVERGLPSLLAPNRDVGIAVFGELAHGVVEYALGVFDSVADNASADGDTSDDKLGVARVFARPFARGPRLLQHLGVGVAGTYGWEHGTPASPLAPTYVTQAQTTFFSYVDTVVSTGLHWRASAQAYYFGGPLGVLAEYVHASQHVGLAGSTEDASIDAWQGVVQWVITGEDATYQSVAPARPFDPRTHDIGAVDFAARYGELAFADGTIFAGGYADPTRSARRARSLGACVDWFPNKELRVAFDIEHTWYWLGAATGDRPPETSLIARVQTVF